MLHVGAGIGTMDDKGPLRVTDDKGPLSNPWTTGFFSLCPPTMPGCIDLLESFNGL